MRQILLEVMVADDPEHLGRREAAGGAIWDKLCSSVATAVPVSGAGVALMTSAGHGGTLAATDGPARALEDLQQTLGEGPCLSAFQHRRPVLLPDLSQASTRWTGFAPAAAEAGVAAVFAFPLQVGSIRLGVLDLYRDAPGPLDNLQLAEALDYAAAAATILLDLQHQTPPGELHDQLADAVDGHRELHQATGIITVQASVGMNDALLLLRARAYAEQRQLLALARDVVAHRVTFHPEEDHHG